MLDQNQKELVAVTVELRNTNEALKDLIGLFRSHCKEAEDRDARLTRLESKVSAVSAIGYVFTAIASVIAGWLGYKH